MHFNNLMMNFKNALLIACERHQCFREFYRYENVLIRGVGGVKIPELDLKSKENN